VSGFDGFRVRADIVHLHTHARVGPKAGGHGELEAVLLFKNKRKIELSVDELTAFEACFQPLPDGPLAFVNACDFASAAYGSLTFSSVLLQKANYRTVIG